MNLGNFMLTREGVVKFTDFGEGKELVIGDETSHTCDKGLYCMRKFGISEEKVLTS